MTTHLHRTYTSMFNIIILIYIICIVLNDLFNINFLRLIYSKKTDKN